MSTTGLRAFDHAVETANIWLNELMKEMNWEDRHRAYYGMRAVIHALRDRLTVDEAAHLGAQLPLLIRGFYYEGWHPAHKPVKQRTKDRFLSHIRDAYEWDTEVDPEAVTRAVFKVIAGHVTAGEIEDVKHMLPAEVRELWP